MDELDLKLRGELSLLLLNGEGVENWISHAAGYKNDNLLKSKKPKMLVAAAKNAELIIAKLLEAGVVNAWRDGDNIIVEDVQRTDLTMPKVRFKWLIRLVDLDFDGIREFF